MRHQPGTRLACGDQRAAAAVEMYRASRPGPSANACPPVATTAFASVALAEADRVLAESGPQNGMDAMLWARALLLEARARPAEALATLSSAWELMGRLGYQLAHRLIATDLVRLAIAYALRDGAGGPADEIVSMSTECATEWNGTGTVPESTTVVSTDWDSIHPETLTIRADGPFATDWSPPAVVEEYQTHPNNKASESAEDGCITQPIDTATNPIDTKDITQDVPAGGLTLLGLPNLSARYEMTGVDATVIAKLWDRAPESGVRTLVTRGVYRLSVAGGDAPAGKLHFKLSGNHYTFKHGHTIQLELSQTDIGYLRPDNLPSSITYTDVTLQLPIRP